MTANETVSMVVERERRRRGLTRLQLAALLGTNSPWVSRKLNGDLRWSMDDLDLVSERLGIPLPVLLMAPVEVVTLRFRAAAALITRGYASLRARRSVRFVTPLRGLSGVAA